MKICKLKLKNLNSFREEIEINFEKSPLDDASLVAITGPTGAGKTTLLDAICVALYGKTPRLSEDKKNQNRKHLISHGESEGFAEVLFMANGTRYLATWSAKQNGSPTVRLSYADDGKLITDKLSTRGKSLGSSQNTVSKEVESILGLDFDAFRRSVMLAQGEFAAFLKADLEDRREILEKTAGIGIYNKLNDKLNEKEKEVREAHEHLNLQLGAISEASCEQIEAAIEAAKDELNRLQGEDKALGIKRKQIQKDKELETKRKGDFDTLQSLEEQQELLDLQPKIDALQVEQENAARADRLRSEKQAFDTATSELESADEAFRVATTEKTEAEKQVEADQVDFDAKEAVYQSASVEHDGKVEAYTAARLNVQRAEERFAEAKKRNPDLADLGKQIKTLESELTEKQTEQTQLQEQIDEAQTFLDENHLPTNSAQRLNDATGLLAELTAHQQQLETASASKAQHEKRASSLKREIEKLSETREEHLAEKTETGAALENAKNDLNKLLTTGTHEEWTARTRQAAKAQPIAQKYEAAKNDLADDENQLSGLMKTATGRDTELVQIGEKLVEQGGICQSAAETVQHCEDALKFAILASPINQLRQHLHVGEPCRVCGATEHPYADIVEIEGENLLQNAETDLENAKADAQTAQEHLQALKTKQIQTEQDKRNTATQIEDYTEKIRTLRNEAAKFLAEWQEIYPEADVSSKWASEQFIEADIAVTDLRDAEQAHAQASNDYQTALQQLETCENNIAHEEKSLNETEKQLKNSSGNVEDLRGTIADIETRFWELLPDAFPDVVPKVAVDQFENKIKEVQVRKDERDTAEAQLQVLNTNVEADQTNLADLRDRHKKLETEIDGYQSEGEAFLDAVREKTGGLEREDEINTAIDALETDLQAKEGERGAAEQQLQSSRNLLIEKQATRGSRENRHNECAEKFEKAHQTYSDRLKSEGFGLPEEHNNAFREEARIQEIRKEVSEYIQEKHQLEGTIAELQTQFKETPFDAQELGQITSRSEEIDQEIHGVQKQIWGQQSEIERLREALSEREILEGQIQRTANELKRWKTLKDLIGENKLFNFASTVILEQVNRLANGQLESLSSGRYQLKAEGIDDKLNLTIVDRWNANEERPVETLSGGESFLTSLALALALSELSRGRSQLNSLFLDEGFGTLDAETLDMAIAALEGLRMRGRSIFLISHVQELTKRLPIKIDVKKRNNGSSYIPTLT